MQILRIRTSLRSRSVRERRVSDDNTCALLRGYATSGALGSGAPLVMASSARHSMWTGRGRIVDPPYGSMDALWPSSS